jgi:hypothetical protein
MIGACSTFSIYIHIDLSNKYVAKDYLVPEDIAKPKNLLSLVNVISKVQRIVHNKMIYLIKQQLSFCFKEDVELSVLLLSSGFTIIKLLTLYQIFREIFA